MDKDKSDDIGICLAEAVIDFYRNQSPDGKYAAIDMLELAEGLGRCAGLYMSGLPIRSFNKGLKTIEQQARAVRSATGNNPMFPTVSPHETTQ